MHFAVMLALRQKRFLMQRLIRKGLRSQVVLAGLCADAIDSFYRYRSAAGGYSMPFAVMIAYAAEHFALPADLMHKLQSGLKQ